MGFRNWTALWTYSGGIVDATTNYRPGGSPSKNTASYVIPVAVGVGVAVGILLIGVAMYILKMYQKERKKRRRKKEKAKFKSLKSEESLNYESSTNVLPVIVDTKNDSGDQTEMFVKDQDSDSENEHKE